MRKNYPVTKREYPFPRGGTLVSTTDLKGRITYCNPSFTEVSGYTQDELLGQAHNLIRHPDMPEEAFRDMWATIRKAQPWIGVVKNRRKNGDYYWVMANVTPLVERGVPVGYMSVRTEVAPAVVKATEKLYATMQEEAKKGRLVHVLSQGRVRRRTLLGRLESAHAHLGMGAKIASAMALCGVAVVFAERTFGAALPLSFVLGVAGIIGALAGYTVQRLLTAPLDKIMAFANRMAAGDLTQSVDASGSDQFAAIQRALNQLNVNLRAITGDARGEVERMHSVMRALADGNQNLSSRTESQAAQLEETAASMEEITGAVRENATSAQRAAELAVSATQAVELGSVAVSGVNRSMEDIREASARIGEVIEVIQDIAFQTNMLALNAAVEAARAGDHGRGFAVVASEVRTLARKAAGAAKEIADLVAHSSEKVRVGDEATQAAQQTMDGILTSARDLGVLVKQINLSSHEQLAGISQVNDAMIHLDGITQQNAILVDEIAGSAESVTAQADVVVDALRIFKLEEKGAGRAQEARVEGPFVEASAPAARRTSAAFQASATGKPPAQAPSLSPARRTSAAFAPRPTGKPPAQPTTPPVARLTGQPPAQVPSISPARRTTGAFAARPTGKPPAQATTPPVRQATTPPVRQLTARPVARPATHPAPRPAAVPVVFEADLAQISPQALRRTNDRPSFF